ncbi:hypothetical protein Cgig2_028294 [Carnegiea gigantea]|uniref:Uncharacterized protein n=1 Tax=Carnegiea gigantea TaxID=171969 RepID=A0A9Q1GM58_9CARY|nr:hypothetical protein Cgig2_028294 [Carnegiea gigantea]
MGRVAKWLIMGRAQVRADYLENPCPLTDDVPYSPEHESPPLEARLGNKSSSKGGENCNSPMCVIREWVPFCEEELKSKEGLEFPNLDEYEKFYKSYAHHVGFSIRKWSSKKGNEGVQKYKYYGRSQMEREDKLISRNWLNFLDCMQEAGRDPEKLTIVSKGIQNVLKEVKDLDGATSESKISDLESFVGSSAPEQRDILPPTQCNTKESGKRLKGGKEKAMAQQAKRLKLSLNVESSEWFCLRC